MACLKLKSEEHINHRTTSSATMPRGRKIKVTTVRTSNAIRMPCGIIMEIPARETELIGRVHIKSCQECQKFPPGTKPTVAESRVAGSCRRISLQEPDTNKLLNAKRGEISQKLIDAATLEQPVDVTSLYPVDVTSLYPVDVTMLQPVDATWSRPPVELESEQVD